MTSSLCRSALLVLVSLASLAGCSASADMSSMMDSSGSGGGERSAVAPPDVGPGSGATGAGGASEPSSTSALTVGLWDDNLNFYHFERFLELDRVGPRLFSVEETQRAHDENAAAPGAKTALDVAFLLDTTGSMGDELAYLKKELVDIQTAVHARVADTRFGVVTYRDVGDAYVTRATPLDADPGVSRAALAREQASGGGDMPEAVADGLAASEGLGWRQAPNVAKVLFWIGDAEEKPGTHTRVADAIRAARSHGIHVYPIAASGVSARAELTMRSAAQYTGGRYLFLTDDSGIGAAHAEPIIPCYVVQKLDAAIRRVLRIEVSGVYEAAPEEERVRVSGRVEPNGRCAVVPSLRNGQASEAWVY